MAAKSHRESRLTHSKRPQELFQKHLARMRGWALSWQPPRHKWLGQLSIGDLSLEDQLQAAMAFGAMRQKQSCHRSSRFKQPL
jgi:hypothetical protein